MACCSPHYPANVLSYPSDPSLTVEKVLEVMGEVRDWERLGGRLEIPDSQLAEIMMKSSTDEEKCRTLGQYWVKTAPNVSWERLAWTLYYSGEEIAAAMANRYLPKGVYFLLEHQKLGLCFVLFAFQWMHADAYYPTLFTLLPNACFHAQI